MVDILNEMNVFVLRLKDKLLQSDAIREKLRAKYIGISSARINQLLVNNKVTRKNVIATSNNSKNIYLRLNKDYKVISHRRIRI